MFIILRDYNLSASQRLQNQMQDYFDSGVLCVESIYKKTIAVTTEYRRQARQWKTREAAEMVLNKLVDFQNIPIKDKGYKVVEY